MNETEDCFAVYTESEMRKYKAEQQKMCDELKAERNKYIQVMTDAGKTLETEKGLHLHDVLILSEKFAVTKKELDELKAENERLKKVVIATYVAIVGLEKCEFDDGCDSCESPEGGIWADMYYVPEGNPEAMDYICGKCIYDKANKMSCG